MKLTTYNFLTSKSMKGVKVGYPLKLTIHKRNNVEIEFNAAFLQRLIPKLDWSTVYLAAQAVDMADEIPSEAPTNLADNDELLEKIHHLLMEIEIVEGELQCPESGRVFHIKNGIPNMLLNEDEV